MDTGQDERLVIALRAAARELAHRQSIRDLEQMLARIVTSAVETVPAWRPAVSP